MQHASIGLQAASTSTLETQLQQAYVLKIEALPCCFALSHSKQCFMRWQEELTQASSLPVTHLPNSCNRHAVPFQPGTPAGALNFVHQVHTCSKTSQDQSSSSAKNCVAPAGSIRQ